MANKTVTFLGEELNRRITLRTVNHLADKVEQEAKEKDLAVNTMLNQILYERYLTKNPKIKSTNHKK